MAHCLEVAELLLRAASFFCGIITAASVKVAQVEFAGHCMLYGSVGYNATSKEFSVASSSNASLCLFVSVISGLITIYCFFVVLYCIYASCFSGVQGSSVEVTLSLAFAATFLFFLLISGCILNIGLTSLCQSITTAKDLKSCQDAQLENWSEPYKASQFYTSLYNAGVSAWVNFFLWVLALILLIVQRKQGTQYTELSISRLSRPRRGRRRGWR
ncbi:transmembrane protein 179B-like isoform X1 [Polyodon spathula]|uniref:transmembrane protein 179B-like isoform X1 n=1 Tax=Polyodon spathula TaxID=7913 RepID=UPI001B7DEC74|nr:transmembrane protein 179B-like isoform X1 [Polyodon spathula]